MIEKQGWLEPIADRLQSKIAAALDDDGSIGNILHGTWLGHPLHAVLTDVPIGSWTAAAVFDPLEKTTGSRAMGRTADAAITVGLIGATAAAVTGLAFQGRQRPAAPHRSCARVTEYQAARACYITSLCLRRHHSRHAGRRYAMVGFLFESIGLSRRTFGLQRKDRRRSYGRLFRAGFCPGSCEAEYIEQRAAARSMPMACRSLVVRRGMRIYAIAETCSAPWRAYFRGQVEGYGRRVPMAWLLLLTFERWAGSLNGPTVHPQPILEVRVRDGRIEVREIKSLSGDMSLI